MTESVERVSTATPTDGRTDGLTKISDPTVKKLTHRYARTRVLRFQDFDEARKETVQ